jgi:flagellar biosynthetic protein FlhB
VGKFDGKTEKATQRRRQQARREGRIPRSQEVGVAASLAGGILALRVFAPQGLRVLREETAGLLGTAAMAGTAGPGPLLARASFAALQMGGALAAPFLAVAVLTALTAGFAQVGFTPMTQAAKPKLSNLSPKRGLQRFAPATAAWDLGRTVAKLGMLIVVIWGPVRDWSRRIGVDRNLDAGLSRLAEQSWTILLRGVLLAGVVAAADYLWNRSKLGRELRMSKDEVRQEAKDIEGDPMIKAKRRQRAGELSRNRMLADVTSADVVVTNPTHLAVALRYSPDEGAPRVVARGADKIAAKIRRTAYRHGVLVTEDKPLARALYRRCKVGAFVPAALYEAVAVVLAAAYRRNGRVAG